MNIKKEGKVRAPTEVNGITALTDIPVLDLDHKKSDHHNHIAAARY